VGGGQAHGPRPRSYAIQPPRKVRKAALRAALSLRAREGNLVVVKALALGEPKTREAAAALGRIGAPHSLVIERKGNEAWHRSARNLAGTKSLDPDGLNVYDVLRFPKLVLAAETVEQIQSRLMP
jgi:large subunit ribosomal protein L4